MQHFQRSSKVVGSFLVLAISQVIAEGIKTLVQNDSFNWLITLVLLIVAAIILFAVEYVQNKRINTGKNTHSIAIRSSKFISDYYRKIKDYAIKGSWGKNEEDTIKTVHSLSRHLLLIGEYNVRYKMGKLIYKYSKNNLYRMSALIDEIGWTAVLMGKKKSVYYIQQAIEMGSFNISKPKDNYEVNIYDQNYNSYHQLFLAARAFRHIASTGFVELIERKEISLKGLAICDYLFKNIDKLPKDINSEKIETMKAGIDYGLGVIYLNCFKENDIKDYNERVTNLMNAYAYNRLSKVVAFKNRDMHRYVKCLLIENEIYDAMASQNMFIEEIKKFAKDRMDCEGMSELDSKIYTKNLEIVEDILNHSIYIDEAYEIFLQEKLKIKVSHNE
ncbi:MAG: hypothetical protein PHT27_06535 [Candidatus Izemoplasmatales bacterium]|nr:hypothetical protein [Candidatus Izemoplasmatales bacterium]